MLEDAVIVRTPDKKGLPSDAEKHWHPPVRIPRHHLVGQEQQRVFKRLYEGSKQMLGCPWCKKDRSPPVPSQVACQNGKTLILHIISYGVSK